MTTRTRAAGILTAITMTALMAACSANDADGGGDSSAAESSGEMSDSGGGSGQAPEEASGRGSSGDGTATSDRGSDTDSVSGAASGSDSAATPETERSIIATGAISLVSKDVGAARREVQRIVDAQGGDVAEENTETDNDGITTYARMVIRVPSSKFSASMEALEGAASLRSSTRGSEDVTTQVIDTRARVRAQEASLKRVELLLAEADSLKDVIWIESQLTSRQAELDSLKSQQAWLEDQTSLSTITVDISTHHGEVEEEETEEKPAGFVAGLKGGTNALGAILVTVATILGALLPFAVLALVLGLPVWLVARRRRTTDTPTPAA